MINMEHVEVLEVNGSDPEITDAVLEVGDAGEEDVARTYKNAARVWQQRWAQPEWNWALLKAALRAGVHRTWRSGKTHGKMAAVKECMHASFKLETASRCGQQDEPLTTKYMWKRLEQIIDVAINAMEQKEHMNPTQWEAFLNGDPIRKGQRGWQKWSNMQEYCNILAWLPAGEDDDRYPKEPSRLEAAKEACQALEDLTTAYRALKDGKEANKAVSIAASQKMARKDSDGLALERYVSYC